MKRFLILCILVSLFTQACSSHNQDTYDQIEQPLFSYSLVANDKIEITGINDRMLKSVELPTHINGYEVIGISDRAFRRNQFLESIVISQGIEYIGMFAFEHSAIRSVHFDENSNLKSIGLKAFFGAKELMVINLPQGTEIISSYAFAHTDHLRSLYIPKSVTFIGSNIILESGVEDIVFEDDSQLSTLSRLAFKDATRLKALSIPNGVTILNDYLFQGATSLMEVDLPETLEQIGYGTFQYTVCLGEVIIPESVKVIKTRAFSESGIEKIMFHEDSKLTSIDQFAFYNSKDLAYIIIPESITHIGYAAFSQTNAILYFLIDQPLDSFEDGWNLDDNKVYWLSEWHFNNEHIPEPNLEND